MNVPSKLVLPFQSTIKPSNFDDYIIDKELNILLSTGYHIYVPQEKQRGRCRGHHNDTFIKLKCYIFISLKWYSWYFYKTNLFGFIITNPNFNFK